MWSDRQTDRIAAASWLGLAWAEQRANKDFPNPFRNQRNERLKARKLIKQRQ